MGVREDREMVNGKVYEASQRTKCCAFSKTLGLEVIGHLNYLVYPDCAGRKKDITDIIINTAILAIRLILPMKICALLSVNYDHRRVYVLHIITQGSCAPEEVSYQIKLVKEKISSEPTRQMLLGIYTVWTASFRAPYGPEGQLCSMLFQEKKEPTALG